MSPVSYHIAQCKHANLVEPNPSLETAESSLALLYEVAWRDQDESALFHQMPVRRDECKMRNVKVPEYMTVLKWKHDTPFLKLHGITGILIRDAYCRMLWAIESGLWPTTEADKSTDAAIDVDLNPRYNPFKTNVKPEEEVEGVAVSGGPGIGKSMFMVYVLTLCLLAHQPVVWQTGAKNVLIFVEEGVYSVPPEAHLFLYIPNGTFYLVDCNSECLFPNIRLMVNLIRLKEAKLLYFASLRHKNFAAFRKSKLDPTMLYMGQCTPEDLICCRLLWNKSISETQLEEFIKLYGSSARNAYMHARNLKEFEENINNKINYLTVQVVLDAISQTFGTFKSADGNEFDSHDIFCIQAHPTDPQQYTMSIHTRFIYNKVMQHLQHLEQRSAAEVFRFFCLNSKSRACVRYIIEDWVIGRLPQGGEWPIKAMEVLPSNEHLYWHDVANGNICYFRVGYHGTATVTDEHIDAWSANAVPTFPFNTGDNGKVEALPETDGIGLPVKENQPTYDLFVWLAGEKRAIMVQVTVNSKHMIAEKGLKQLKAAGAQHLDLIVVTPVLTDGETMSIYTDIGNQDMLECVYHLSVTEKDMKQIPEPPSNL